MEYDIGNWGQQFFNNIQFFIQGDHQAVIRGMSTQTTPAGRVNLSRGLLRQTCVFAYTLTYYASDGGIDRRAERSGIRLNPDL